MASNIEVKITIAEFLELAYSKDKGMTTKIMRSIGNFKLTVDQDGKAVLSGSVGILTFEGDTVLSRLGAKIKSVSISFSHQRGNNVNYVATYSFRGAANISVSGSFDIEELILRCSGLLCRAARAFKGHEMELKRIMRH